MQKYSVVMNGSVGILKLVRNYLGASENAVEDAVEKWQISFALWCRVRKYAI